MKATHQSLESHFAALQDPRRDHRKRYELKTILILAVLGVISGANDWVGVERICRLKYDWLKTLLDLPNGIPSHDTFRRVFSLLPSTAFQTCFMDWAVSVSGGNAGELAVYGKTMRRSHDATHGTCGRGQAALELVSAWATSRGLVLARQAVKAGSNEIAAVSEVLSVLVLKGRTVTVDALSCQTANKVLLPRPGSPSTTNRCLLFACASTGGRSRSLSRGSGCARRKSSAVTALPASFPAPLVSAVFERNAVTTFANSIRESVVLLFAIGSIAASDRCCSSRTRD